ncbi:MAG: hypothetical protein M0P71_14720 [Melioribacteraceae bacterium]|jgi:hypothetical protein|nr:hypothetical protein [Melioribacteraceae bacterium]
MKREKEKMVRVVSVDPRYRKETYPAIAIYNSAMNTYITGQHIDVRDPSTKGNLTKEQIEGTTPLTDEQLKKFKYVIKADFRVRIQHMRRYNNTVDDVTGEIENAKDYAELNFLRYQDIVAKSKKDVVPGTHYFYLEDAEKEAEERINQKNLVFKAMSFINRNSNINKFVDLAILLNYKIADCRIDVNGLSPLMIQDKLMEYATSNPNEVISCFGPSVDRDLFILKAENKGLITKKGNSYFDGQQYLGDNLDEINKFISSEAGMKYKTRWMSHIEVSTLTIDEKKDSIDNQSLNTLKGDLAIAIMMDDFDKAEKIYDSILVINPSEVSLVTFRKKIDNGKKYKAIKESKKDKSKDNEDSNKIDLE